MKRNVVMSTPDEELRVRVSKHKCVHKRWR